ncbi:hypothetical protein F5884DRAFT_899515 [Xylogone sp. PMI_703]|nr:hypothetical protein F5884DRAFT_899515 [Xylogone sp. PMI_703]
MESVDNEQSESSTIPSIFCSLASSKSNTTSDDPFAHLKWYECWVQSQLKADRGDLLSILPDYNADLSQLWRGSLPILWREVYQYMISNISPSIENIVLHLSDIGVLQLTARPESLVAAKNLVFAIIAWQTMLYRPDIRSSPPIQISIVDDTYGYQGQARMSLKQSHTACRKPMHEFLLGFGMLLPPRNFNLLESPEDKLDFNSLKVVTPQTFNLHLLTSLSEVQVEWTDSLSCHLEFDKYSKTLFIFRYPSFCVANLPSQCSNTYYQSVLHACAAPETGSWQWATPQDVTQMLYVTLLSYRLLFGQMKASRRLFRKLAPFEDIPEEGWDNLLIELCGHKRYRIVPDIAEREHYDLPHDFPIYRGRLVVLLKHLSIRRPRTWKQLWHDKRDSASWLTFWTVLIFGGMGIFLAVLQTALQLVQVMQH